ncbi:MAG: anion permease [Saprospiraceae bacterium]|jgi:di/tricarboxylate transporter|nr:anion permease [Saprospiraceae bacterium]
MEIIIVLSLLVTVVIIFATEKMPVDLVTIGMLIILTTSGILTPSEAFSGYGSDFIMMLASIFVVGAAMQKAGLLDIIGEKLFAWSRNKGKWLSTIVMSAVSVNSAFMNNTSVTAVYVAPMVSLSRKLGISPSKLLMPVAFASILGGTCTVIGTSTNIAVNSFLADNGYPTFGMFDFMPIGILLCVIGIVYMNTIGHKLLPDNREVDMIGELKTNNYFTEILVKQGSSLVGEKIKDTDISHTGLRVLNIIRDKKNTIASANSVIEAGDVLLVEGRLEDLLRVKETTGMDILADTLIEEDLVSDDIQIAELIAMPSNDFVGATIRSAQFKNRFGLMVIAISREGHTLSDKIGDIEVKTGDHLLVQGPVENIRYWKEEGDLTIIQEYKYEPGKSKRNALLSGMFFVAAIIMGSLELIPLSIAFMLAAFLCVLFKCIKPEEAYEKIEWKLLVLIGGMSSFSIAMKKSGTADFMADQVIALFGYMGPMAVLAAFAVLTALLTQPISNAAAALVVLPVALRTAVEMQVNPLTFALVVMLSASVSLITPFEPSCILVFGPGRYKVIDFIKVGAGVTILLVAAILLLAPMWYPL